MHPYQQRFIELAITHEALRFGEFELKSGRRSPYFFDAGRFHSGSTLAALGDCYADAVIDWCAEFDMLFGPAYKGIPLATSLVLALARRGLDLPVAFSRKEIKTHGEGGALMGAPLNGRVLIVDDVITAGTAVREAVAVIEGTGAQPAGVLVLLDRQERGQGSHSAAQEVRKRFDIEVRAIACLTDLLAYTLARPQLAAEYARLSAYRAQFGVTE